MNAPLNHLIDQVLALEPAERTAMVVTLLDSLEAGDEAAISAAWSEEIRRRRNEIRSGAVQALPWDEAKARLSAL